MIKNYELYYIIDSTATEEQREALINKINNLITSNGGSIEMIDKQGIKKFAYPINFKTEGFYVLMNFTADSSIPQMMEKQLLITDFYVRGLFLVK